MYVIGGSDEAGLSVATNEAFDLATGKWETHRSMPTARNHPAGGAVGGKLYVIGGRLTAANVANMLSSATDIVEEYDPSDRQVAFDDEDAVSDEWTGWITFQNRIYVAGGELRDAHLDAVFRDFVVFDPAANDWYRLPSMPTARHGVVLTALGNRIHAVAGHTAFNGNGAEALHSNVNENLRAHRAQIMRFWRTHMRTTIATGVASASSPPLCSRRPFLILSTRTSLRPKRRREPNTRPCSTACAWRPRNARPPIPHRRGQQPRSASGPRQVAYRAGQGVRQSVLPGTVRVLGLGRQYIGRHHRHRRLFDYSVEDEIVNGLTNARSGSKEHQIRHHQPRP
jgi:hypothetical protein